MCNKSLLGFLNIDKPKGMTSHDVVSKVRRILNIKQVGHSGTLDPFATGVLPIAIGKATKLIEYLDDDKEYLATIKFGANTTTYDLEGEITQTFDVKVSEIDVINALTNFEGEISQIPPVYSAIKVNGKKLYDYARAGDAVEIKPRQVIIHNIELVEFNENEQVAKILVACSKGTYIRSIAYDLGKILNCGGYLIDLRRTRAGNFSVDKSINIENLKPDEIDKFLINPVEIMDVPTRELTIAEIQRVQHGMSINNDGYKNSDIVFLVYSGKIYAVGMVSNEKILVKKLFEVL